MSFRRQLPAFAASTLIHAVILGVLAMLRMAADAREQAFEIETVIADEARVQEEFVQELDPDQTTAEAVNFLAGGASANVGGSQAPLSRQIKVEDEDVATEPELQVEVGLRDIPAPELLTDDLGEAEVTGETGAVVEGYGAALNRMTKELIRLMRSHKLLVVWLFDESKSMKDDQQEIKERIGQVYEELELVEKDASAAGFSGDVDLEKILLTVIASFGKSYHVHTGQPTGEIPEVMQAIDEIPVDPSGSENMCRSLLAALNQYQGHANRGARKIVVILVSDESGDDGKHVEQAIQKAKTLRAPVYVMGREAVFGYPYAYVRWQDPATKHWHLLPIRRGPETPYSEQLQWNGFWRREDAHMSGFGPYEQVRIARETGGIFFQLPHEQQDLNNYRADEYEQLHLKEYVPDLASRRRYAQRRDSSQFRKAIWDVITLLNPYGEGKDWLNLPKHEWFPLTPQQYADKVRERLKQITRILDAVHAAQQRLASVEDLRATEPSVRWRANYDLIRAQLFAYRVRLFEYGIALDRYARAAPQLAKKPESNRWSVHNGTNNVIMPDPQQQELLGVTPDELQAALDEAKRRLAKVAERHADTPWAARARWERNRNFGVSFREHHYTPPKKPRKKRPKPTPKPKL